MTIYIVDLGSVLNLISTHKKQMNHIKSTEQVYFVSNNPNTIYVGTKPVMSYVLAVISHFNESKVKDVTLKAR